MTAKKSDDAVSPVIGIMLMLVVTVIIAAVVAAFATGMVGEDTGPAPNAKMGVKIYSEYGESFGTFPTMHISHVSGDPLATKDLKLTFTWDCDGGEDCLSSTKGHHSSTYQYETDGRWGTYSATGAAQNMFIAGGLSGVAKPSGYTGDYIQPLYINYGKSGGEFFGGSLILERGMTLQAFDVHLSVGGKGNPAMDALLNNGVIKTRHEIPEPEETDIPTCPNPDCGYPLEYHSEDWIIMGFIPAGPGWYCPNLYDGCPNSATAVEGIDPPSDGDEDVGESTSDVGFSAGIMACLPAGTPVDVKIIHIPTNKPIYSKTVYVQ